MESPVVDATNDGAQNNNSDMGKVLIELWSRLNNSLSQDMKDRLKNIMEKYEDLSGEEKKDFEENAKNMINDAVNRVASNQFWSATTNTAILIASVGAVFIVFGMIIFFYTK